MALSVGSRLGPYEILSPLGAGGMGEVYRARDTKLNREVALKVLPETFAADAERLARFKREAQVLASLNHPHIAAIYGFEDSGSRHALVLELVEGPTLADRIAQGPIPLDEALPIAKAIAEALEAAHEQGIIHRDLKPANVKLRSDGTVKVLDFGLAKAMEPPSGVRADVTNSPTITTPAMTGVGIILGTAAYMSPEQAKGRPADKRSDVWAFGCVLYEMLTGTRAFEGEDVSDTLAAVLRGEPDWTALQTMPAPMVMVIRGCLAKERRQRISDLSTPLFVINTVVPGLQTTPAATGAPHARAVSRAAIAAALVLLGSAGGALYYARRPPRELPAIRFVIAAERFQFGPTPVLSISPDGTRVVFVASVGDDARHLWVRSLNSLNLQPLEGTDGANSPFWSPDGRYVGFVSNGRLKKIPVGGGTVTTLGVATGTIAGGTWSPSGTILFAANGTIFHVSATGGTPPAVLMPAKEGREGFAWPSFLPDGKQFLYIFVRPDTEAGLYLGSLNTPERKLILRASSNVTYVPGYLLFAQDTTLMAQPFDLSKGAVSGEAVPIVQSVAHGEGLNAGARASFAASDTGVLVYVSDLLDATSRLTWMDRAGRTVGTLGQPQRYRNPRLSPDGSRVAVEIQDQASKRDLWLLEVQRDTTTRFTFDAGNEYAPIWSPDGLRIGYSIYPGPATYFQKSAAGTQKERMIAKFSVSALIDEWLPGDYLVGHGGVPSFPGSQRKAWTLPLDSEGKLVPLMEAQTNITQFRVSPDGHWIAYVSSESGRSEVFMQDFPAHQGKWQVSTMGGVQPVWRRDRRELFFVAPDNTLMAVPMALSDRHPRIGTPVALFKTLIATGQRRSGPDMHQYDVAPDGQRFLVNNVEQNGLTTPINVVVNWPSDLPK